MSNLNIEVKIDGEIYTDAQLAQYEYQRALHVLHELKALGADVHDSGRKLSHEDINWLEPEKVKQISLDIRNSLGEQGTLNLFKDAEADAECRWKEYIKDYDPTQSHIGVTEIHVTGITIPEVLPVVGGGKGERFALEIMPEHYIVKGNIVAGEQQRGMEAFGMFGEPTFITGTASKDIPEGLPIEKDPSYPKSMFGETLLKSDGTNIHIGAFHQFRPEQGGFSMKSTFFCPGRAPKAIADGHKIHFALELTNSMKIAYSLKQEEIK